MVAITVDWVRSFQSTERNYVVSLLEKEAIIKGSDSEDQWTTADVEAVLLLAGGQIIPQPTIPPAP